MNVEPSKPITGPADWFTGEVRIDVITAGHGADQLALGNVHFAPGARTAWHSHSVAQTLYVMDGEGLVQARGEAAVRIRPGDVVSVAAAEWHWHGAAPGVAMTHMSLTEGDTQWGERVTDAEYRSG